MHGVEPGRDPLAVPARQLALQPGLPLLSCYPRSLLLCLEQARRPALDHHVDRPPRLGSWVLINGIWYYSLARRSAILDRNDRGERAWQTSRIGRLGKSST